MQAVVVPYGVLSIASYLESNAHDACEVKILDFNTVICSENVVKDMVYEYVSSTRPDVVGISVIFTRLFTILGTYTR